MIQKMIEVNKIIKRLNKEIKIMEKMAEGFTKNNKFIFIARNPLGIDAIVDLTNFVLEYDRKCAVLDYLEDS